MIFERSFDNLSEAEVHVLNQYFDGYDYQSSSYTFIANYIWRNTHKISWQIIGEYLCIAGLGTMETDEEEYFMSFPLTRTGNYSIASLKETLAEAKKIFESKGRKLCISLVPGHLISLLSECLEGQLAIHHDRDDDDYIYLKSDLVNLSGRKLHQKKNHLNFFRRNYEYVYEEATSDMVPEILSFIKYINDKKAKELSETWSDILELESQAIDQLLQFVGEGILAGVIRINGKIEAVTVGEFARTNDRETVIVHVEKASDKYRGIYQAINNEFCKRLPEETIYVNREEDMGMETLRQTKLSYKPCKIAEKYSAIVK